MSAFKIGAIEMRLRDAVSASAALTSASSRMRSAREPQQRTAPDDIAEALSWFHWLEAGDAELVRARVQGAPWKLICFRFGISRPTAWRRFRHGLALIAWRLNGNSPLSGCSRRRFLQMSGLGV